MTPPSGTYSSNAAIPCTVSGTGTTTPATTPAPTYNSYTLTSGTSSSSSVCYNTRNLTLYSTNISIQNGMVFNSSQSNSPYNGGGQWFSNGTKYFQISSSGVVSNAQTCQTSGSYTFYISSGKTAARDFCGGSYSVSNSVTTDGSSISGALGERVFDNGGPFNGGGKKYIVSTNVYSYQGSSTFTWWEIDSNGLVTSNGTHSTCSSGPGDPGGGGDIY